MLSTVRGGLAAATDKMHNSLTTAAGTVAGGLSALRSRLPSLSGREDPANIIDDLTSKPKHIADVVNVDIDPGCSTVQVTTTPFQHDVTRKRLSDLRDALDAAGWDLIVDVRQRKPHEEQRKNERLAEVDI